MSVDYHEGKIGSFVKMIAAIIKKNPLSLDNHDYLMSCVRANIPEITNREKCPNCEAPMKEFIFSFDAWDALLLIGMAKAVKYARQVKGLEFNAANQVRIPELPVSHAVRCRTTQSSKLGLITAVKTASGRRVPGTWLITRRGWQALRGDPVPWRVKVWRNRIIERPEETITINQALKSHTDYVERTIAKGRKPREDQREAVRSFNPQEWYDFGIHEGEIF